MVDKESIFPLGIGTWKIDKDHFQSDLEALKTSVSGGQNFLSLYMLYEDGEIVRLSKKLIDSAGRENLFINTNLEGKIKSVSDVEKQLDEYLDVLGLDYVDSLEIHHPWLAEIPLIEVYGAIQKLVTKGKVRYKGISDAMAYAPVIPLMPSMKLMIFDAPTHTIRASITAHHISTWSISNW